VPATYRFDRFELRPSERVLLADGMPVALGSRAFDLLLCLVTHRDRVLTKAEVLEQVWPGQVVEENNLSVHVSALRKVLGTGAITTVSGRGYRFTCDTQPDPGTPTAPAALAPAPAGEPLERPSLAVLPLSVLSDDPHIAFFAQGLVEDVTALLARVPGFVLIAHASTQVFRGQQAPLQDVARQLGVRFLVQGSVRPKADALRVSLQLIEVASARILWSAQFDSPAHHPSQGAIDAQEHIARGIISELEPELTRAEIAHIRRQRPENLDAWAHYHEAVGALAAQGWSAGGMATARAQLRLSTSLDPGFGLSHGHYALLTILASSIGMVPDTPDLRADALAAANSAITLDDGSSEVLGYAGCALCDLGHYKRGIDTLQQALELNPSNAQAHVAMGAALAMNRKFDEGVERMRYGMKISPRDRRLGFWGWLLGRFLLRAERVEEALVEARLSCRADPRFHLAHVLQAATLDRLGATGEAIAALRTARQHRPPLTLEEVTLTHGRRISERLAVLWDRAGGAT
jgi:TolB-like protein